MADWSIFSIASRAEQRAFQLDSTQHPKIFTGKHVRPQWHDGRFWTKTDRMPLEANVHWLASKCLIFTVSQTASIYQTAHCCLAVQQVKASVSLDQPMGDPGQTTKEHPKYLSTYGVHWWLRSQKRWGKNPEPVSHGPVRVTKLAPTSAQETAVCWTLLFM